MKILVAIANYGQGNRGYLLRLLENYHRMGVNLHVVILSNCPKDLGPDVEVRVGLPSSNPWSLPFAHRTLFRERLQDYDWFIYSEDDTLMEWRTLEACMEANRYLREDEIPGFLRVEEGPEGKRYFSTCHSHFRWLPSSVRQRNGQLWAYYTNEHSACFVASRQQIQKAIDSGGFPVEPYEGRYDMLCTAATDIYRQCGFERLICIDRIPDFSLHHLPNKYIGRMGLPEEELKWQVDALREIYAGNIPDTELFNPETKLPGGYGSKRLRDDPDPIMKEILRDEKGVFIIWGAGDGKAEIDLMGPNREVGVVAQNWIMAKCCQNRGLSVFGAGHIKSGNPPIQANVIVLMDVLHLLENPAKSVAEIREWLKPNGLLFIRVPNLRDVRMFKKRWQKALFRLPFTYEAMGCHAFKSENVVKLLGQQGFKSIKVKEPVGYRFEVLNRVSLGLFKNRLASHIYLTAKKS